MAKYLHGNHIEKYLICFGILWSQQSWPNHVPDPQGQVYVLCQLPG